MSEISDEELADYFLGLRTDLAVAAALDGQPELRRRCRAMQSELGELDREAAALLDDGPGDGVLAGASWRILLAVDGSPRSRRATQAALALARRSQGSVEVLHVRELAAGRCGGVPAGETRSEAAATIGPLLGELHERGVVARGQLRSAPAGRVARHILLEAQEMAADVIVIGASSPSPLAALRAPRVGKAVVRKATCPVLVV